ncbi:hypothetical protein BC941DRAFT_442537 [Chlamydoabsidia padenii]|nr:hypothetical protein BC941DRAFT_442537 [Chlamydoabsidia padenii]
MDSYSYYQTRRRSSDDEPHGQMSDTEETLSAAMTIPNNTNSIFRQRRHSSSSCSSLSSTPLSPACSYNKMSVDSDDGGRSMSSSWGKQQPSHSSPQPVGTTAITCSTPLARQYLMSSSPPRDATTNNDTTTNTTTTTTPSSLDKSITTSSRLKPLPRPSKERTTIEPERRTVRRTSLLLKSKALSRVQHQAEEEIHLADLEMRRENGTLIKSRMDDQHPSSLPPPPPSPYNVPLSHHHWPNSGFFNQIMEHNYSSSCTSSTSSSPTAYQCSKLNPEIEMTASTLSFSLHMN